MPDPHDPMAAVDSRSPTTLGEMCAVDDPPPVQLTGAEVQMRREALQLTVSALARALDVHESTVRGWETGHGGRRPPAGTLDRELIALEDAHDALWPVHDRVLDRLTAWAREHPGRPLTTIRDGERDGLPARWHRAVCLRVVDAVPGTRVVFEGDR